MAVCKIIPLLSLIFVSNKIQDEISFYLVLSCIFSQSACFASTCSSRYGVMLATSSLHQISKSAIDHPVLFRKGLTTAVTPKKRGFNSVHPIYCHRFVHQHKSPPSTKARAITTDITRRTYENSNNRNRNRTSSTTTSNNSKNTNKNT